MNDVTLSGYIPGAIGRIVELHGNYYHKHWGFGLFFESMVATGLSEFLRRRNEAQDGFWVAHIEGEIVGSIAIDGIHHGSKGAHLRWFIVAPEHQGQSVGNLLLGEAIKFCNEKKFNKVYLWTFAGLDAARHLYEKCGFRLCEQCEGNQWGKTMIEQRFELAFYC
jgi:GNAT superfamily N-acetyltransferase